MSKAHFDHKSWEKPKKPKKPNLTDYGPAPPPFSAIVCQVWFFWFFWFFPSFYSQNVFLTLISLVFLVWDIYWLGQAWPGHADLAWAGLAWPSLARYMRMRTHKHMDDMLMCTGYAVDKTTTFRILNAHGLPIVYDNAPCHI